MFAPLDDATLFPLQSDASRVTLKRLREHPHAPIYNRRTGDRLTAQSLENVRAYAADLHTKRTGYQHDQLPPWLIDFVQFCREEVPYHRARADWTDDFFALPPMTRETIRARPWELVPDSLPLDDLIVYTTSGTTGDRLKIISHPEAPSRYLPAIQLALARVGVTLNPRADQIAILQICAQRDTTVMSSVSSYLNGAGFAKINLAPKDWRDPAADVAGFIDDCDPLIYTGDPFAFAQLMNVPLRTRPKAIVSSATALLPGLRAALATHFACPIIDLYSMNESGPVAFSIGAEFHEVLPHDLYVEILDDQSRPCPPGTCGEITLSGGNNLYLPLLRYRTGDFAALDFSEPVPRLVDFQGRRPVVFITANGQRLNAIDVTTALRDLPLPWFALHQSADRSLTFRAACDATTLNEAHIRLRHLFGDAVTANSAAAAPLAGKAINYTSDLTP